MRQLSKGINNDGRMKVAKNIQDDISKQRKVVARKVDASKIVLIQINSDL